MTDQPDVRPLTRWPAWLREVDLALPVSAQYLLTGNIHDLHIGIDESEPFTTTADSLRSCLAMNGYDLIYRFDPLLGIVLEHAADGVVSNDFFPDAHLGKVTAATPSRLASLVRLATSQSQHLVAIVIEDASALWGDDSSIEVRSLLLASRRLAANGTTRVQRADRPAPLANCLIWLADHENDAPSWLVTADTTRKISVARPALSARRAVAEQLVGQLAGVTGLHPDQQSAAADQMAASSEGLTIRDLRNIVTLAVDGMVAADHLDEAVRSYLAGVLDSPWQDPLLLERLAGAGELIGRRVLGQDQAIDRALDILLRSAMGLTGAQSGGRVGRPQGILFFAGPTGVGKTELAKALAQTLFGSEDAYTRFDMSEFSAEHSEARLIGAPPGYVGFSAGAS